MIVVSLEMSDEPKFLGYSPDVAVIGDLIVGLENRYNNANVHFLQSDTLDRLFAHMESRTLKIESSVHARIATHACEIS